MVTRFSVDSPTALRSAGVEKPPDTPRSLARISVWLLGITFTYV